MSFSFDLISDLHIESWSDFDWTDQATSPYCVVAGDVSIDRRILIDTLTHLGQCYAGVFYIDGNDEHKMFLSDLGDSYKNLQEVISTIPNVIYLQDNVVVINGVAILATNGWWTYDFDPLLDFDQSVRWYEEKAQVSNSVACAINGIAYHDSAYLMNSVKKLQTHADVHSIVLVSHTVPAPRIIAHDPDLSYTWRFNCMGNRHLQLALDEDTENKIKVWAFGHYHRPVDQEFNGIRYVNNCRGRGDTEWRQSVYFPKRITL